MEEKKGACSLLLSYGKTEINDEVIVGAEKFLLKCITSFEVESFDELCFLIYHTKHHQFDLERFPPTSACTKQYILRAYLQCYMWLHVSFIEDIQLDNGYMLADDIAISNHGRSTHSR